MFYIDVSCEDCKDESTFNKGDSPKIRKWNEAHKGHRTHVNLLGHEGCSIDNYLFWLSVKIGEKYSV
jgi:hypothetical protein